MEYSFDDLLSDLIPYLSQSDAFNISSTKKNNKWLFSMVYYLINPVVENKLIYISLFKDLIALKLGYNLSRKADYYITNN